MQQGKQLVKNTALYAVANFGSKILSFLIVPLYTHYVETGEMGTYDLIISTITLLVPFITFQMSDGIYRWLLDPTQDKECVIHMGLRICLRNFVVLTVLYALLSCFVEIPYQWMTFALLIGYSIVPVLQQIARGLGKNGLYAVSGVLITALFLAGNMVFVVMLGWGCEGMLLSQMLAYGITLLVLLLAAPQIVRSIKAPSDRALTLDMMRYSLPLIPNVVSWWTINTSNRYIILWFLGTAANGVYSISTKFPSVLQTCSTIFYLAWQEMAIKDADASGTDDFGNNVFQLYIRFLFLTAGVAIPLTRIYVELFVDAAYLDAWKYCAFLYLGMVFSALSSFLGAGYQAAKRTRGALSTTIWAALVSIGVSASLTGLIGLQAVSLSVFVAYVFLFLIRWKECSRIMRLTIRWRSLAGYTVYGLAVSAITQFAGQYVNYVLLAGTFILFVVLQWDLVRKGVTMIRSGLHDRRRSVHS